ncbi:MAG: hypothetical protein ACRCYP_04925, partial [Alphaproteobacteria bacterium]
MSLSKEEAKKLLESKTWTAIVGDFLVGSGFDTVLNAFDEAIISPRFECNGSVSDFLAKFYKDV